MTAGKKLGVCIVGCGDMGTKHAERWRNVAGAEVVAVVDVLEGRAETLARAHQLEQWYTDYRPAVSLPQVDVVSVCVPTCDHPSITIFAAGHGKHVLCEKPIALTLAEADKMIETARANGVKLGLGFMRQYSPVMAEVRAWLAAGELGRPVMYHAADVRQLRPKREMHDAFANGGPVIDMGVHLFDGWATLFDAEPVTVMAQGLRLAQERPELAHIKTIAYDTASIVVRYNSGDVGTFLVSWGLPPGVNPENRPDQIFGPKGAIQLAFSMTHQEARLTRSNGDNELITSCREDMYQREIDDFARTILDNQPPKTSGEAGKFALRLALAALESIETGQVVRLG